MEHWPVFWIFNVAVVLAASTITIFSARMRKGRGSYLCEDCRFNDPESCLKSDRPQALVCTSYRQVLVTIDAADLTPPLTEKKIDAVEPNHS